MAASDSRVEQGLSPTVEDPAVLRKIARMFVANAPRSSEDEREQVA